MGAFVLISLLLFWEASVKRGPPTKVAPATGARRTVRPAAVARKAKPSRPAFLPPAQLALGSLEPGAELRGIVLQRHADKVFVDVSAERPSGENSTARVIACVSVPGLRALQLRLTGARARRAAAAFAPQIGAEVSVTVTRVEIANGRLIARVVRRPSARDWLVTDAHADPPVHLEALSPARELRGVVVSQTQVDAFVDCNVFRLARGGRRVRVNGRLPLRELPAGVALRGQLVRSEEATRALRDGDTVSVWAREVLPSAGRFTVTMVPRSAEEMAAERAARLRQRRTRGSRPLARALAAGSVRAGVVAKRLPYGVLVDVGAKSLGLLHASALPDGRADLRALEVGARVSVRVLGAGGEPGRGAGGPGGGRGGPRGEPPGKAGDRLQLALASGGGGGSDGEAGESSARLGAASPARPAAPPAPATTRSVLAAKAAPAASSPRSAAGAPAGKAPGKAPAGAKAPSRQPPAPRPPPVRWEEEAEEADAKAPLSLDNNMDDYLEDKYG